MSISASSPAAPLTDRARFDHWQSEAVDAWERAGGVGIVEAVTGAGKTHVAFRALARLRAKHRVYPLIVVPTIPLMSQWKLGLERAFPGMVVGLQGDGHKDTFATFRGPHAVEAIVSTIHSGVTALRDGLLDHLLRGGVGKSLIVADECHHVLSRTAKLYPRVLAFPFDFRLGLSATVGPFEIGGIGRIVYEYTLRSAVRSGVIPPFDIVNVGIDLTVEEATRYLELGEEIRELMRQACIAHDLDRDGGDALWIELHRLATAERCSIVRALFGKVFKKAALVYTAQEKTSLAPALIRRLVEGGRKLLVFFERIESAETVGADAPRAMAEATAAVLGGEADRSRAGVRCHLYHSGLSKADRAAVLDRFRADGPSALLACRALNEGLDVPSVDAAVIVASTQSRRAMIQRIGRTLRQEVGKRRPLIALIHARGTNDDQVQIAPNDDYFAGPARIFQTDGREAVHFVGTLGEAGAPPADWIVVFDRQRDGADDDALVLQLGELANGPVVRVHRRVGDPLTGVIDGVTRRPPRVIIGGMAEAICDVRRVAIHA